LTTFERHIQHLCLIPAAPTLPSGYYLETAGTGFRVKRDTGAYVARGKTYANYRQAVSAAMRSCRMVRYHHIVKQVA